MLLLDLLPDTLCICTDLVALVFTDWCYFTVARWRVVAGWVFVGLDCWRMIVFMVLFGVSCLWFMGIGGVVLWVVSLGVVCSWCCIVFCLCC